MGASRPTSMDIFFTWFTQFAFASGDSCTGWQVRKGTGFVPIEDLPSEDEEQDEEEAGFKHAPALFQTSNLDQSPRVKMARFIGLALS